MPQGSVLSPMLFSVFINDLLLVPWHPKCVCFADDFKLVSNNFDDLKKDVAIISNWCDKNFIDLNIEKCGLMILKNKYPVANLTISNLNVPVVSKKKTYA